MKKNQVKISDHEIPLYSCKTIIVGSGAAGLNAAKRLYDFGYKDLLILTEGLKKGTSRNTGSDKQTYYKLSLSGSHKDSVYDMAKTYFDGGAMHGDIAKVEAALSVRSFYHLVEIGVPFPHSELGEYVGYKTDHDPAKRATSAGPLTSHFMTEKLEFEVKKRDINIMDQHQLIAVLTDHGKNKVQGLIAIDLNKLNTDKEHFVIFNCNNVIYATGGPANIYHKSVYPGSQTGASGLAFEAGVKGQNLTESQFGIASTRFRWNLSGTYQQVIPRYISTDQNGNDEKEFLNDYFNNAKDMINAIFLKGYQWPFDPRKVLNQGSSLIDILVYNEQIIKGRKVWLDYTKNPEWASNSKNDFDFNKLSKEAYSYLKNSDVLMGKPIDRLIKMNKPAYDLYKDNNIDLAKEKLEIAVCAQHNNGGLLGNKWWESNLQNLFPVGEVNGSHGVYRPGGSALNSGQVGSLRAAEYIYNTDKNERLNNKEFISIVKDQIISKINFEEKIINNSKGTKPKDLFIESKILMSEVGAIIRSSEKIIEAKDYIKDKLSNLKEELYIDNKVELKTAFHLYDSLITQLVYLYAINDYINNKGKSRGSYLISDLSGKKADRSLPDIFKFNESNDELVEYIQTVSFNIDNLSCQSKWVPRKGLKNDDLWFENEWKKYRDGEIYN